MREQIRGNRRYNTYVQLSRQIAVEVFRNLIDPGTFRVKLFWPGR